MVYPVSFTAVCYVTVITLFIKKVGVVRPNFFGGSGLSRPSSGCALVYLLLTGIILWIPYGSPIIEYIYWEAVDSTCLYHKLEMVIAPKSRCSRAVRKCAVTKRRLWKHLKKWPVDTYLRHTYCDCV